jgi:hypothetical protein
MSGSTSRRLAEGWNRVDGAIFALTPFETWLRSQISDKAHETDFVPQDSLLVLFQAGLTDATQFVL